MHTLSHSVFSELRFWLMVLVSIVLPFIIYTTLLLKRAVSRVTVLLFGFTLVAIAGIGVFMLQLLATGARASPSLADDVLFVSELSTALYLFPAMFGGIGVNMISHVLVSHLAAAERRFVDEHPDS